MSISYIKWGERYYNYERKNTICVIRILFIMKILYIIKMTKHCIKDCCSTGLNRADFALIWHAFIMHIKKLWWIISFT